jgi:hypothetical protein
MSMSTSIYTGPEGLVSCGLIPFTKGNMASEQVRVRVTIFSLIPPTVIHRRQASGRRRSLHLQPLSRPFVGYRRGHISGRRCGPLLAAVAALPPAAGAAPC